MKTRQYAKTGSKLKRAVQCAEMTPLEPRYLMSAVHGSIPLLSDFAHRAGHPVLVEPLTPARHAHAHAKPASKPRSAKSATPPSGAAPVLGAATPPSGDAPALGATTPLAAPSALTAAVQSGTSVVLNWTDNDPRALGYYVLRSTDDVNFSQTGQINSGAISSYTDNNAKSGSRYYYEVEAYGSNNLISAPSNTVACTTPLAAPSALTVAIQNNTNLQLKWNDNANSATGYYVLRSTNGTSFSLLATLNSSNANQYTDNAVSPGVPYTYEVQAFNPFVTSPVSSPASLPPLSAPSSLTVAIQNNTNLQLKWNNNANSATGYYVLRSANGTSFSLLATLNSSGANQYTDNAVSPGVAYTYEVEAFNAFATSPVSNPASLGALSAPSGLTAAAQSSTSVKLNWNDNASAATGYNVLRSTNGASFSLLATLTSSSANSYIDNTAGPGLTYAYEVQAFNPAQTSAVSNAAGALIPTHAPSSLAATAAGSSVKLTWTDNDPSAAGYLLLRSGDGVTFTQIAKLSSASAAGYADTTVSAGRTYSYEVQACYSDGATSAVSNAASAAVPTMAPPSGLAAAVAGSSVNLTWTDNDPSAAGYLVMRSGNGVAFAQIAQLNSASAASYADTTSSGGQTYYYQVQAFYSGGAASAASNIATAVMPTHAPSSLAAAAAGSSVNLTWTDNDPTAAGYLVLRSGDGVSFTQIAQLTSASASSYADATVSAGQTYYYEVQAWYSGGATSAASNAASVTVPVASVSPTPSPTSSGTVAITTRYTGELVITASGADDSISVTQSGSTLTVTADGQSYSEPLPADGLFIYTRGGTDSINIGQSVTVGTIVETIDGAPDTISSAGAGVIAWIDSTDTFSGTGTVHRVSSLAGGVSKALGASLPNPSDAGATTAVNLSLFGAGPVASDVNQGYAGDCYFLSSLAAFAAEDPSVLTHAAVDMGDGTYLVDFNNTYVRVNNQFSTGFAHPGANNTIWAMVMEKAFAYYRTGANTYASTNNGWMGEVYSDFGVSSSTLYPSSYSQATLYNTMASDLANGEAVTFGTYQSPPNLVSDHCYTLIAVSDVNGVMLFEVRNPWGVSGDSLENSQGYAMLTYAQLVANFVVGCQAIG